MPSIQADTVHFPVFGFLFVRTLDMQAVLGYTMFQTALALYGGYGFRKLANPDIFTARKDATYGV